MTTAWMETFSGGRYYPLVPEKNAIDIKDIAHSLALMCRFNGHCRFHYSVAQHSLYVSYCLPERLQMAGLLHDAAEAILSDIISPMKQHMDSFRELEQAWLVEIFDALDVPWPSQDEWQHIKFADDHLLVLEAEQLMVSKGKDWVLAGSRHLKMPAIAIRPFQPRDVEKRFLQRYEELKS